MKKLLLTLLIGLLLIACSDSDDSNNNGSGTGFLTGKVVDTQGNPIDGVKILLDNAIYYNTYLTGTTQEDGTYKIRIEPGAWNAYATFKKEYNGQVYPLRLHPDNDEMVNEEGMVINFNWKLEGRYNEHSYYGGFIQLVPDTGFYEEMENIKLTLMPSGPLIDGSQGQTLQLEYGDHYWVDNYHIEDIPIGRYTVKAVLQTENGDQPLHVQNWETQGEFGTEVQIDFIPDDLEFTPTNYATVTIGY